MRLFLIRKTKMDALELKIHVVYCLCRSFTVSLLSFESWGVFDSFEEEEKYSKEIEEAG